MDNQLLTLLAKASYFLAAVLFILGIKRMSSPVTARKGIVQAGIGMVIATLAAFGAGELLKFTRAGADTPALATLALAVIGALIGSISMTGSIIAWAKLDGRMDKRFTFGGQQFVNFAVFAAAVLAGAAVVFWKLDASLVVVFFLLALAFGILMTLPIGGADMPVVISLYNALTG